MSTTNFTDGTVITSSWLNDVDAVVYETIPAFGDSTNAGKGAAMVGFSPALNYATQTLGRAAINAGPSLASFLGVVMDSSGASQRTANSAALIAAAAITKNLSLPPGTFWIDPSIEIPASLSLTGAGTEITFIKGDGDLFKITAAGFGSPVFRDLTIANDSTRGKLFRTAVGADIGRVQFERVNFGKATYHIYAADICVDWLLLGCKFTDASIASRAFPAGLWAHNEVACYTWYNAMGLDVGTNSSSCNIGGVFEFNTSYAIRLTADNASTEIDGWSVNCHFEGNGSAAGVADVLLVTSAATRIRSIDFSGSRFSTPNVAQTIRINETVGGGGNIDHVTIGHGSIVFGTAELCPNSTSYVVGPGVYFQSGSINIRDTNIVPLTAQSQFSSHLGAYHAEGPSAGSSATVHTVTPPTNTKLAEVFVQGNIYNGTANSHVGILRAVWRVSGGRITTYTDTDHSSGSNQGWIATWTGTAIQIANKAAMTNNQSGDVTIVFYG